MITTLVQFQIPTAITLEEATAVRNKRAEIQNLAGLIRKYYIRSEDGRVAAASISGSPARGRARL
jgi:hypothetical protein